MQTSTKRPTEAWINNTLFENGLGHVIVARFNANGATEAGVFLVDTKCLGVKNAFLTRLSFQVYQDDLLARVFNEFGAQISVTPACARKLIEDSIAYARGLGF